jgi:hypothetical protein
MLGGRDVGGELVLGDLSVGDLSAGELLADKLPLSHKIIFKIDYFDITQWFAPSN